MTEKERKKRLYEKRKRLRVCTKCGKMDERTSGGNILCRSCAEKKKRCAGCGGIPEKGHKYCLKCAEKRRQKALDKQAADKFIIDQKELLAGALNGEKWDALDSRGAFAAIDEVFDDLVFAILKQAVLDYFRKLRKGSSASDLESFFRGRWFYDLSGGMDGEYLMNLIKDVKIRK